VARAARIAEAALQPGQGVLQQIDGLLPSLAAVAATGIIAREQLHQGSGDLLGGAASRLILDRMPFPITDGQLMQQPFRQIVCSSGPSRGA
jgi:hypothetical protein